MKKCSKCKIEKRLLEFSKDKSTNDGCQNKCKSCEKKYREYNAKKIADYQKEYRKLNKYNIKEYKKEYYKLNKDRLSEKQKGYYKSNKEVISEKNKEWQKNNKDIISKQQKEYYNLNKERIFNYQKAWQKQKKQNDPLFKLKHTLRTRTYYAFKNKGYSKNTKTQKMLGVDWNIAKQHIERKFTKGMNWSNHGEWHIDHIIPLASANTEQRLKELCHYSNLQPMWASDNISKSDKINGQQTKIRI